MTDRNNRLWQGLTCAALVWAAPCLQAQTLDEITVQAAGRVNVVRVTFNAAVRVLRQSPGSSAAPGSLYRIDLELVAADDAVARQTIEESRRVVAGEGTPEFTVLYQPPRGGRGGQLTLQLSAPRGLRVIQGPSSRTIDIVFQDAPSAAAPAPAARASEPAGIVAAAAGLPASAPAVADPAVQAEVERQAADLYKRAQDAMATQQFEVAIGSLNQLLRLPPNAQSQQAQELIGNAWDQAGDPRRAAIEYRLYLKLYPQGEGAARVSQRLAAAGTAAPVAAAPAAAVSSAATPTVSRRAADKGTRYTGSIAQYYYGGKARSQSLVNLATGIDQSTLTNTTESAVITSLDLGARYLSPESDTHVVFRGTGSTNLLSTSHSASLLNAAYVDYKRTDNGLALRLGRQSPISGGLLGFFDGLSLSYPFKQKFKFDLMGGVPANPLMSIPSERLLAAMVEGDGLFDNWGGNVYFTDQSTQGISNRRALGTEVRYSNDRVSAYSLLDYDTLFKKVNAFSLQGSVQAPSQTTLTLLLDSRNAPSLQMSNALISSGATSLKTLLQMESLDQVRAAALATTAEAKQAMFSLSRPISEKWQLSTDLRYSAIGALPAVGNFEATPATGAQYGLTVQLTGSNLYSSRDINNINLSLLSSPTFKGEQISYNNLTGWHNNDFTLEPSIRLYTQSDNQGIRLWRITPGLRASYRLSRRASVLGESILEHSTTSGPVNHDTTNSIFFYVGYRYDLF